MLRNEGPASIGNRAHPTVQRCAPNWGSTLNWPGTIKACWVKTRQTPLTRVPYADGNVVAASVCILAGLMGGKPLCWLGGLLLLLSVICTMLLMMAGLSAEEPAADTEEDNEGMAGLLAGGGPPKCCCCCAPFCRSSSRSSSSVV